MAVENGIKIINVLFGLKNANIDNFFASCRSEQFEIPVFDLINGNFLI